MAEKYSVVRTDNLMGTDVSTYLDSVRFYNGSNELAAIENGNVVLVGDLLAGEREVHKATPVAANSDLKKVALVANPEVLYDERKRGLDQYINEAGKAVRVYYLHSGDEFGITAEGLDIASGHTVTPGTSIVELKAGTKLHIGASATASTTQVGKVIAVEKAGRYTYYVIRVA